MQTCNKHLWSDETFDEETGNDVCELCGAVRDEQEKDPIQAINDHLNAITDLLATTKELDKSFITAILRHVKGFKASLRKEVIK